MASFRNNVDIYHVAGNDMQLLFNQFTHLKYTKYLADKYISKKIILKLEGIGLLKAIKYVYQHKYIVHLF